MRGDEIQIHGLQVATRIGVPDEERREPQHLLVNLRLLPVAGFEGLGDAVGNTTDYETVANEVRELCGTGERRLVETLAEDIAGLLLKRASLAKVEVEIRKFILPECDYVGVKIQRGREVAGR